MRDRLAYICSQHPLATSAYRLTITHDHHMANPLISNNIGKKAKYTKAFLEQNGPGDARPTAHYIHKDNDRIGTMKEKVSTATAGPEPEFTAIRSFFSPVPLEESASKLPARSPQLVVKRTWAFATWRRGRKL